MPIAGKRFANLFFGEGDGLRARVHGAGGQPSIIRNPDWLQRRLENMLRLKHEDEEEARRRQIEEDEALAVLGIVGLRPR